MAVDLFDTVTPLAPLKDEIKRRMADVVDSGKFILGPEVSAFESEFADYLGARHVIGVANGTDALTIALRAMGVGPGDEVVVPSLTFYASAEAIPATGATPVFCDVDADTYCVSAKTVEAALTPRTKAVIAVDLLGNVAPIDEIEALGVPVLEDAAQAAGSTRNERKAGTFGRLGTFSFYPGKNLGCFGDGGAVVTDDDDLAELVRMLRFHGSRDKVTYQHIGYNSRLDSLQAAVLRVLLRQLDGWAATRVAAGEHYAARGLGEHVVLPQPTEGTSAAWHLYFIRHPEIDTIAEVLRERGIGCRPYYRTPIHRQEPMREFAADTALPVTDELAATHLAIPMSAALTSEQAAEVTDAIRDAVGARAPA